MNLAETRFPMNVSPSLPALALVFVAAFSEDLGEKKAASQHHSSSNVF